MKSVIVGLGLAALLASPAFADSHNKGEKTTAAKKVAHTCSVCKDETAPADAAACQKTEWLEAADKTACEAQSGTWHEPTATTTTKKAPAKKK